jgi:hypothetical protein
MFGALSEIAFRPSPGVAGRGARLASAASRTSALTLFGVPFTRPPDVGVPFGRPDPDATGLLASPHLARGFAASRKCSPVRAVWHRIIAPESRLEGAGRIFYVPSSSGFDGCLRVVWHPEPSSAAPSLARIKGRLAEPLLSEGFTPPPCAHECAQLLSELGKNPPNGIQVTASNH